jgi:hypothetical protein
MCQVPERSWRTALSPARLLLGLASIAASIVGAFVLRGSLVVVVGICAGLLLAAVALPVVREVEFGFPSGVRVVTATRDRRAELRAAFEDQQPELSLIANLLYDDPEAAAGLIEAVWSRSVKEWRGPPAPGLRVFLLCTFVHLVTAHQRWGPSSSGTPTRSGTLSALPLSQRTAVVLHEFAELTADQIAAVTERPVADLIADLSAAQNLVTQASRVDGPR